MRYIKKKEMRSTAYSQEVLDLANKYRLEPHKIKYVIDKYGSMNAFIQEYREGNLDEETCKLFAKNLRTVFCIDAIDPNADFLMGYWVDDFDRTKYYRRRDFTWAAYCKEKENPYGRRFIRYYYSIELFKKVIEKFKPEQQSALIASLGLFGTEKKTLTKQAKEVNVTAQTIRNRFERAREKLYYYFHNKAFSFDPVFEIDELLYQSNAIFYPDERYKDLPCDIDFDVIRKKILELKNPRTKAHIASKMSSDLGAIPIIPIEDIGIPQNASRILHKARIDNVDELICQTYREIEGIKGIGRQKTEAIFAALQKYNLDCSEESPTILGDLSERKMALRKEAERVKRQCEGAKELLGLYEKYVDARNERLIEE